MVFQVMITVCANNAAKKLTPEIKKAAKAALRELAVDPFLGKELQVELSGFRSLRFMRYRIVYKVDTESKYVVVWAIGHRRDIYETMSDHILSFSSDKSK
jgi:mRNA interferase RelE/StbE